MPWAVTGCLKIGYHQSFCPNEAAFHFLSADYLCVLSWLFWYNNASNISIKMWNPLLVAMNGVYCWCDIRKCVTHKGVVKKDRRRHLLPFDWLHISRLPGPSVLRNFNLGRDGILQNPGIPGFFGTGLTYFFHPGIDGIPGFFGTGLALYFYPGIFWKN